MGNLTAFGEPRLPKIQLFASLRINSSEALTWFPMTLATTLLPFWLLDGRKLRKKNNKSMTSSPLRDFRHDVFKASRGLRKSPHANKVLMLGIDVGQLHVKEHQDLQRANSTSEAEPDANVDDLQLRELQGPGLCIFSLAAEF